jgi:hypothetical protein
MALAKDYKTQNHCLDCGKTYRGRHLACKRYYGRDIPKITTIANIEEIETKVVISPSPAPVDWQVDMAQQVDEFLAPQPPITLTLDQFKKLYAGSEERRIRSETK